MQTSHTLEKASMVFESDDISHLEKLLQLHRTSAELYPPDNDPFAAVSDLPKTHIDFPQPQNQNNFLEKSLGITNTGNILDREALGFDFNNNFLQNQPISNSAPNHAQPSFSQVPDSKQFETACPNPSKNLIGLVRSALEDLKEKTKQIQKLKTVVEGLNSMLNQKDAEISRVGNKYKLHLQLVNELKAVIKTSKIEIKRLNSKIESDKQAIKEFESAKSELQRSSNKVQKDIVSLREENETFASFLNEKNSQIEVLKVEVKKLNQEVTKANDLVLFKEEQINMLNESLNQKNESLVSTNKELSQLADKKYKEKAEYYEKLYKNVSTHNEYLNSELSKLIDAQKHKVPRVKFIDNLTLKEIRPDGKPPLTHDFKRSKNTGVLENGETGSISQVQRTKRLSLESIRTPHSLEDQTSDHSSITRDDCRRIRTPEETRSFTVSNYRKEPRQKDGIRKRSRSFFHAPKTRADADTLLPEESKKSRDSRLNKGLETPNSEPLTSETEGREVYDGRSRRSVDPVKRTNKRSSYAKEGHKHDISVHSESEIVHLQNSRRPFMEKKSRITHRNFSDSNVEYTKLDRPSGKNPKSARRNRKHLAMDKSFNEVDANVSKQRNDILEATSGTLSGPKLGTKRDFEKDHRVSTTQRRDPQRANKLPDLFNEKNRGYPDGFTDEQTFHTIPENDKSLIKDFEALKIHEENRKALETKQLIESEVKKNFLDNQKEIQRLKEDLKNLQVKAIQGQGFPLRDRPIDTNTHPGPNFQQNIALKPRNSPLITRQYTDYAFTQRLNDQKYNYPAHDQRVNNQPHNSGLPATYPEVYEIYPQICLDMNGQPNVQNYITANPGMYGYPSGTDQQTNNQQSTHHFPTTRQDTNGLYPEIHPKHDQGFPIKSDTKPPFFYEPNAFQNTTKPFVPSNHTITRPPQPYNLPNEHLYTQNTGKSNIYEMVDGNRANFATKSKPLAQNLNEQSQNKNTGVGVEIGHKNMYNPADANLNTDHGRLRNDGEQRFYSPKNFTQKTNIHPAPVLNTNIFPNDQPNPFRTKEFAMPDFKGATTYDHYARNNQQPDSGRPIIKYNHEDGIHNQTADLLQKQDETVFHTALGLSRFGDGDQRYVVPDQEKSLNSKQSIFSTLKRTLGFRGSIDQTVPIHEPPKPDNLTLMNGQNIEHDANEYIQMRNILQDDDRKIQLKPLFNDISIAPKRNNTKKVPDDISKQHVKRVYVFEPSGDGVRHVSTKPKTARKAAQNQRVNITSNLSKIGDLTFDDSSDGSKTEKQIHSRTHPTEVGPIDTLDSTSGCDESTTSSIRGVIQRTEALRAKFTGLESKLAQLNANQVGSDDRVDNNTIIVADQIDIENDPEIL